MAIPLNYDCKRVRIYVTCTILYSMLEYMYVCICTVCMHCVNIYIKAWSCWLLPKTGPSLINYLEARFYMQTILYMTLYPKAVSPIMTFGLFISNLMCSFHRVDEFWLFLCIQSSALTASKVRSVLTASKVRINGGLRWPLRINRAEQHQLFPFWVPVPTRYTMLLKEPTWKYPSDLKRNSFRFYKNFTSGWADFWIGSDTNIE